jgi:DNA-binding protein H-NS
MLIAIWQARRMLMTQFEGFVSEDTWYQIKEFKIQVMEKKARIEEVVYGPLSEEYIQVDPRLSNRERELYSYMNDKELRELEEKELHLTISISNEHTEADSRRVVIYGGVDPEDFFWENKEGSVTLREHNSVSEVVTV